MWTGDGRVFFYNPSQRLSLWEKPEELLNRPDVDKLLQGKLGSEKGETTGTCRCTWRPYDGQLRSDMGHCWLDAGAVFAAGIKMVLGLT